MIGGRARARGRSGARGAWQAAAWQAAAFGVAAIIVLALFAGRIWMIPAHVSTDPNEGWNAFQAARALGGGPLYPQPGAPTGNNYPPLSFFVVGGIGKLVGDNIVAGRIVALASLLVVAGFIFASIRALGGRSGVAPAIGVLMFLGFNATLFRSYLAMDDPQWLAHAAMTAALFLLLAGPHRPAGLVRIVAAALLMLTGGFVKHNLVAFPLAATIWLMAHDRRGLAAWTVVSAIVIAASAVLLRHVYGAALFVDLLASDRHYSALRMLLRSAAPVAMLAPMILVALRLRKARLPDIRIDLLLLLVAISVPLGILQRSGQGVDRNAHFEALVALSIAAPVSLLRCGFALNRPLALRPLFWLVVPLLVVLPGGVRADWEELLHRGDRLAAWNVLQDRIAATPGRVACETQAICYWGGKAFEIDFFLGGQRLAVRHDAAGLRRVLAAHRFRLIELDPDRPHPPPGEISNPLRPLVLRFYRTVLVDANGRRLLAQRP